eukprot:5432110-Pleurochrysis_carterae.AAC.1
MMTTFIGTGHCVQNPLLLLAELLAHWLYRQDWPCCWHKLRACPSLPRSPTSYTSTVGLPLFVVSRQNCPNIRVLNSHHQEMSHPCCRLDLQ